MTTRPNFRQLSRKAAASVATTAKPKDTPPIRRSDALVSVNSIPMAEDAEHEKSCSGSINKTEINRHKSISQASVEGTEACTRSHKNSASAASHTYDRGYGKWAKFDVDSALQSIEDEEKVRVVQKTFSPSSNLMEFLKFHEQSLDILIIPEYCPLLQKGLR